MSRGRRRVRWGAIFAGLGALVGCDTPVVEARALWLDEAHPGGDRTVHVYSRGALETATLEAAAGGHSTESALLVELDPRGRGALAMLGNATPLLVVDVPWVRAGYLDFDGRRALPLRLPMSGARGPAPVFSGRGDALAWIDACAGDLEVVPLDPSVVAPVIGEGADRRVKPLRLDLRGDAARPCPLEWGLASGADAPVLFAIEAVDQGNTLELAQGGEIVALRYPASAGVDRALVELGRGVLPGVGQLAGGTAFAGLGLVDPDGVALSLVAGPGEPCRIYRWSWVAGESEAACVWSGDGDVVAAISPRHYVVVRDDAVVRVDWLEGEEVALPLAGGRDRWTWKAVRGGRALVFIDRSGPILRVASDGLEVVNIEMTECPLAQDPVISPSGRWAAWSCSVGFNEALDVVDSSPLTAVVRASVGGLERYDGVAMWAVAIDETGELLLYSRADASLNTDLGEPAGSPRNLYVLGSDAELSRVDALEPDPELSAGLDGRLRWVTAVAL
ncbi:MAG: hypothetical protein H6711_09360 [Myxococcales bacterium]|nr:hypothetical protein [Myxococcales bacterium]